MGFWIYMLIMDLLLPLTMIGFGKYFIKKRQRKSMEYLDIELLCP
ncbi:hypothetical protein [Faecalicoccus acidiformans]|nr:hypothetical protein [Faecalicoccus acidiformans]